MKHGQELAHPPQLLPGLAHPPRLARAPALAHAPVSLMDCIKHEKETCAKAAFNMKAKEMHSWPGMLVSTITPALAITQYR